MLLNSDTLMTPTLIGELVSVMGRTDDRIAAPESPHGESRLHVGQVRHRHSGPMLDPGTIGRFQPDDSATIRRISDWVIGNACMLRRESLKSVGLFDEDFWQCNEDVGLVLYHRARAAGFRVVYVDRAAILPRAARAPTSRRRRSSYGYFIGRNAFTFARKHGNIFQRVKLFVTMTTGIIGRPLFFTLDNAQARGARPARVRARMLDGMRGSSASEEITVQMRRARDGSPAPGLPGARQALARRLSGAPVRRSRRPCTAARRRM
jgi:GT2 family glycosyltransferase